MMYLKGYKRVLLETTRYTLLTLWSLLFFVPLAWLTSTSLTESGREFAYPPQWIPDPIVWYNYVEVFESVPFFRFFVNTVIVVFGAGLGIVISASLVAYGFARFRFPGRNVWFIVMLGTMMLPDTVTLVPHYVIFQRLGWIDTLLPLIVPFWFGGSAFNVFIFRQFFTTIPKEFDEAARIDGASIMRIYTQIILPLSKPVIATVAILAFVHHWNDFARPLIFLNTDVNLTLAVGLRMFSTQYGGYWNLLMAGSVLTTLPMLLVFLFGQKYFVEGIVMSGLSGR